MAEQRYTSVRLLSGVPFDNTYAHTRWFGSESEQAAYFTGFTPVKQGANYSYQRAEGVFRVDAPKDSLLGVNYMMFKNSEYINKWFYAFVTHLEYKNDTTFVHFQIDVLQTWMFNFSFRQSYIVRQHSQRYLSGKPVVNTIDEQLMYGSDYDLAFSSNFHPMNSVNFMVLITSERAVLEEDKTDKSGTIVGSPSSFNYYIVPVDNSGNVYDIKVGSTPLDRANLGSFEQYISFISDREPFLNRVIAAYMTSYCGINFVIDKTNKNVSYENTDNINLSRTSFLSDMDGTEKRFTFYGVNKVTSFDTKEITITDNVYTDFMNNSNVFESKCLMYPYCLLEMTDMKGNVLTLKPEYLKDGALKVRVFGSLGVSNKVSVVPVGYNASVSGAEKALSDFALIDSDPTDIGIKSDYAAAMIQGERNSLKAQNQNIIATAQNNTENSLLSGVGAVFSGVASGNPMVAMTNAMGSAQQYKNGVTEKENALNMLSAKIKDIYNVPDTVKQMGANSSFSIGNFHNQFYIRWKIAKPEYMSRLDNYFKTYGTRTLDIRTPVPKTRRYWNFLKTKEVNITGTINITDLTLIKQIFDAGITLWHDNDVLNYNRQNTEV